MTCAQLHSLEQRLDALVLEESGRWLGSHEFSFSDWTKRRKGVDDWLVANNLNEFIPGPMGEMGIQNGVGTQCVVRYDTDGGGWLKLELPCADIAAIEKALKAVEFVPSKLPTVNGRPVVAEFPVVIIGFVSGGTSMRMEAKADYTAARGAVEGGSYFDCSSSPADIRVFFERYTTELAGSGKVELSLKEENMSASKKTITVRIGGRSVFTMLAGEKGPCIVFGTV
jgi:hypothetical protein